MQEKLLKPTKSQMLKWLSSPEWKVYREAISRLDAEEEKALLQTLDSDSIHSIPSDDIGDTAKRNQAVRAARSNAVDKDWIITKLGEKDMLETEDAKEDEHV
jgi:hypothetical protein